MKIKLLLVFILLSATTFSQIKNPSANEYYSAGLKQFNNDNFRVADSLFNLSITLEPSAGVYFYLAVCKKRLNDICGYCDNIHKSALLGDVNSDKAYNFNCIKRDSINYKNISTPDLIYYSIINSSGCAATKKQFFAIKNVPEGKTKIFTIQENDPLKNTDYNLTFPDITKIPPQDIHDLPSGQEAYTHVEQMPEFPGGENKLAEFLGNNIVIPDELLRSGKGGTVYISFIIDQSGSVVDVKVFKGIGKEADAEALRVIRLMPRWKPGRKDGIAVRVQFNMPLRFTIGNVGTTKRGR
jgi:TonB family protein